MGTLRMTLFLGRPGQSLYLEIGAVLSKSRGPTLSPNCCSAIGDVAFICASDIFFRGPYVTKIVNTQMHIMNNINYAYTNSGHAYVYGICTMHI
jgi:hypothetical protein